MKDATRPDATTRELLRAWGPREVPLVQVTGGEIKPGTYRALATLGWIERRGPWAIVGVNMIVLNNNEDKPRGAVTLGLPVTKRTELYVNGFLCRLGWDGRVWPHDDDGGWPEKTDDEASLRDLMKKSNRMGSTLCFPSHPERGVPIIKLPILKRSAPFNWAPFEPAELETPPAAVLDRFRKLCEDPSPFVIQN